MPRRIQPQCYWCKHYETKNGFYECEAFAQKGGRIPREIWWSEFDHRQPHPHDNGILFEKLETKSLMKREEFEGYTEQEINNSLMGLEKDLDAMNAMEGSQEYWDRYFALGDSLDDEDDW